MFINHHRQDGVGQLHGESGAGRRAHRKDRWGVGGRRVRMALWTSLLGSVEPLLPSSFYFIYFWLCWVFLAVGGLSLFAGSRGYSLIVGTQFLIAVASFCCGVWAPGHVGFSSFDPGLVALRHVESSWTRDRTHVPSTLRQTANHWTTREVP